MGATVGRGVTALGGGGNRGGGGQKWRGGLQPLRTALHTISLRNSLS